MLGINATMFLIEFTAGLVAHSTALMADSVDMLGDALVYALSLYVIDRVVDVMEELVKFTLLTRDVASHLVDRYSERKESAEALSRRVQQQAI